MATYTTNFADLNTLMQSLTTGTVHNITITDLTDENLVGTNETTKIDNTLQKILLDNSTKFVKITAKGSYTRIRHHAFYQCTNLHGFTINNNIDTISYDAFNGTSITSIYLRDNLQSAYGAFRNCTELSTVQWSCDKLAQCDEMFEGCTSLRSCDIHFSSYGPRVYSAKRMFKGCSSLTDLGSNVTFNYLRDATEMFKGCSSLTAIPCNFPALKTATGMFSGCTALTTIDKSYGSTVQIVCDSMFEGCTGFTTLTLNVLSENSSKMFKDCTNLTSITITYGSYLKNAEGLFKGCSKLATVTSTFPNVTNANGMFEGTKVASIHSNSFNNVTTAQTMYKGTLLTTADLNAFSQLQDATSMFENCTSLTTVNNAYLPALTNATTMFKGCSTLTTINNWGRDDTANITMTDCFSGCSALNSINVPRPSVLASSNSVWHFIKLELTASQCTIRFYKLFLGANDTLQVERTAKTITYASGGDKILSIYNAIEELVGASVITDTELKNRIQYEYPTEYTGKGRLPEGNYFILKAKDPDSVDTNIKLISFIGNLPIDTRTSGNLPIDTRTSGNLPASRISGTLPVANGGTGQTSLDNVTVGKAKNSQSLTGAVNCSTSASTAAKTVTLEGFTLVKGAKLIVNLQNANTAQSALTLNVNGTGAKTIRWNGSVTSSSVYAMTATQYNCYYDGTYWNMDSSYEARSARASAFADQSDYSRGTAYCTTASGTQAKVANMRGYVLAVGGRFPITFTNANSYNGKITLNVNSEGAKDVYINGSISSSTNKTLPAGTYMCSYYNDAYYIDTIGKPSEFDILHPVGEVYTQYPLQKSPNELWGSFSTWTEVTDYDGAFFRASGGNASAFISSGTLTKQSGQNLSHNHGGSTDGHQLTAKEIPAHTHNFSKGGYAICTRVTSGTETNKGFTAGGLWNGENKGASSIVSSFGNSDTSTNLGNSHSHTINSDGGTENRPDNFTVKIWKRTS